MPIDLLNFVRKWNASELPERSAAPQHFRDLCEVLEVPHPTQADEIGTSDTYEKRVAKTGSGEVGFADVWKRGFFAWEYKSKGGDLKKAYKQLNTTRFGCGYDFRLRTEADDEDLLAVQVKGLHRIS